MSKRYRAGTHNAVRILALMMPGTVIPRKRKIALAGMDLNTESRKKKPRQQRGVTNAPKIGRRLVIRVMPQQAPSIMDAAKVWSNVSTRETVPVSSSQVMLLAYQGNPEAKALLASMVSISEISGMNRLMASEKPARNTQHSAVMVRYPRNRERYSLLNGKKEMKQARATDRGIEAIPPSSRNCGRMELLMVLSSRTRAVSTISLPINEIKNSSRIWNNFFIHKTVA